MEEQIADENDSHDDKNITIQALSRKTRIIISTLLNPVKIIPSDKGLPRDWQGLADLCKISGEKINSLRQHTDPSNEVLDLWSKNDKTESTIDKFILFLEDLDRFDILEDISTLIDEDIESFKKNPNTNKIQSLNLDKDPDILTVDDVCRISEGLEPQTYDAFVLFADDDIDFATELIDTMEKQYNLKFCVKDRDLVGGGVEHDAVIKLISERCGRLIVIVSSAFLESSANKFFYSFAQAIGIGVCVGVVKLSNLGLLKYLALLSEKSCNVKHTFIEDPLTKQIKPIKDTKEQRQRKIIPCLYKDKDKDTNLTLPKDLAMYHMLDYTRSGKLWNFWDKLYNSIRTPKEKKYVSEKNTNIINRSQSQYNSSSQQIRPIFHNERSMPGNFALAPINQVKFNSMVELNAIDSLSNIIPDENISSSNSANSLGTYPANAKKDKSIYTRLKKIIRSKSAKNSEIKAETAKLNNVEKERKRTFFNRVGKKKTAVANQF